MTTHYNEVFTQLVSQMPGSMIAWLRTLQTEAFEHFIQQGIPTRRDEHWKYHNLNFIEHNAFSIAPVLSCDLIAKAKALLPKVSMGHLLVWVNGYCCPELSDLESLQEIKIKSLATVLEDQPELIKPYLQSLAVNSFNQFTQLNTAFIRDGLYLNIPAHVTLSAPLHVVYITISDAYPIMCYPRQIVVMEEHSQATIFEEHMTEANIEQNYYKNIVSQLELKRGAQLTYYKLQNEDRTMGFHQAITEVSQQQDSQLSHLSMSLGAKWARDDITVHLNAKGAFCRLNGLYKVEEQQQVDHHTRIDHHSPQTVSEEYYKGVLDAHSVAIYNGKVIVHPGAQQVKSSQTNKNLLLSPQAEVNTKPELEIYADDVQCAHGATTGQVDETALFYLRSRGIPIEEAKKLLVQAFIDDILERITQKDVREYIDEIF